MEMFAKAVRCVAHTPHVIARSSRFMSAASFKPLRNDVAKFAIFGQQVRMATQARTPIDIYGDELNAIILPGEKPTPQQLQASKVECHKVAIKTSTLIPDGQGDGAFARVDIKKGELVERGVVRRVPVDGNASTYVFTWSDDRSVWAIGSGTAMFYNSEKNSNTKMVRFFEEDRFEIYALRDIAAGEELTHKYRSLEWRTCFDEIKQFHE